MKRLLLIAPLLASCMTWRPVEVEAALGAPEDPVQKTVGNMKLAVVIPPTKVDPNNPNVPVPLPRTRVEYTPTSGEEYPSRRHMESSIPAALKEAGFDVVPVRSVEEAKAMHLPLVLRLLDPQIEGYRRASGGGVSLEGTIYDIHVHYRAQLLTSEGVPVTEVSGHGESTTNFLFDDRYLELAVVGAVSLVVMAAVTALVAIPGMVLLGLNWDRLAKAPVCDQDAPDGFQYVAENCGSLVQLSSGVATLAAVGAVAALSLAFSKTAGGWIFGGITGAIKSAKSEGIWLDMVKSAHDRAARSFATSAAQSVRLAGGGR